MCKVLWFYNHFKTCFGLLVCLIYTLVFDDPYLSLEIIFYELIPLAELDLGKLFSLVHLNALHCLHTVATNYCGSFYSNLG